jgi:hypothetical protein
LAGRLPDKGSSTACGLHADQVMTAMLSRVLRAARRWMLEIAENFPIPVEDVMWVERSGHSLETNGTVRVARQPRKVQPWPRF